MKRVFSLMMGVFLFFEVQGCVERSATLIHPGTGATARCVEAGSGLMAANVGVMIENCVKEHEARGYLPVEKLSREQKTDLEKRGLMPKPAAPMGY